jgi:hypothetical protein
VFKDGTKQTDLGVNFCPEKTEKYEYIGQGPDGMPTKEGKKTEVEGKNLEIWKLDDVKVGRGRGGGWGGGGGGSQAARRAASCRERPGRGAMDGLSLGLAAATSRPCMSAAAADLQGLPCAWHLGAGAPSCRVLAWLGAAGATHRCVLWWALRRWMRT